ncbi:hypothetical protein BD324DRAFT_681473 [Kockovaella imperatae]|uniref:Protein CPL1-like domain-containing protein n=1 Tax=Kockovaella imperatae TaxID=4999 RepID=A0A1Y1UF82_9TREE|nr:hypothetical protein BD324DRAFT_681473 [Kockovaella imperatae]ORX36703.1 hypothetical protein BD324DRAFT_681473 [Kockovaella imperatae]
MLRLFLVALLAAQSAVAITNFIGCATELLAGCIAQVGITDQPTCVDKCAASGYRYIYYQDSLDSPCYCSANYPTVNDFTPSSSPSCDTSHYTVERIVGTFTYQFCAHNVGGTSSFSGTVSTIEDCFSSCGPYTWASWINNGGTFCGCWADSAPSFTNDQTCTYPVYKHTAGSTDASGIYRKRDAAPKRMLAGSNGVSCPGNLLPCLVAPTSDPSWEDSYECLDTVSDLEACGGCPYGLHPAASPFIGSAVDFGQDCSAIPGVALGGVTCAASSCVVTACRAPYELDNGICV